MAIFAAHAQTSYSEAVLHDFQREDAPRGSGSYAGLLRDEAGNLYGTTEYGGAWGQGVVFKIDPAGHESVLYTFTGRKDGGYPEGGLVRDQAGNFYGTTNVGGGDHMNGVIFKLDPTGQETVLHSFSGKDGSGPTGTLVRVADGDLYGTTVGGGTNDSGVVYKLDAAGNLKVLYSFQGGADGARPNGGLVLNSGYLYGTAASGGDFDGVVFRMDLAGNETVLHTFMGGADGIEPLAGVVLDQAGNIYGTTRGGGAASQGTVFRVSPSGQETVLYSFPGGNGGGYPQAPLVMDSSGNLYGTAAGYSQTQTAGVVFEVSSSGTETVLHVFSGGTDGLSPFAGLILDTAGNLFGTTYAGGLNGQGTVFEVNSSGEEQVLYSFPGRADGIYPQSGVTIYSNNIYGTTYGQEYTNDGNVYKVDSNGHYAVLHSFTGPDGADPYAGVTVDAAGNLYGTTYWGGVNNLGTIYKIKPSGDETVLYSFTGEDDGSAPTGGVTLDAAGNLYGTATFTKVRGYGVLFKLDTQGNYTVLHAFEGGLDGKVPEAAPVFDAAGNLYGTTTGTFQQTKGGTIYKVDTAGNYSVLYNFTGGAGGFDPESGVVVDAAGNLYGTAFQGGIAGYCAEGVMGCGLVYKLDPLGNFTLLYTFMGESDGGGPLAGLTMDAAGDLYGSTLYGGSADTYAGYGVVFELDAAGNYTVIHAFNRWDGNRPYGGITIGAGGILYGTTQLGGKQLQGVVFALSPE
ncbi:MAG: choice-of-anchor tandem repeat GloVer-containing protein [Bryobacteraceae bacterium]